MSEPAKFSVREPLLVFLGLLGLLALSAVSSHWTHGVTGTSIGLGIAVAKTALIFTFFMRLRRQPGLVRLFAVAGFFWLLLIGSLVFADYFTRG